MMPHRKEGKCQGWVDGASNWLIRSVVIHSVAAMVGVVPVQAHSQSVTKGAESPYDLVPAPSWFRGFIELGGMFRLVPPEIPVLEVRSSLEKVVFPSRYPVCAVNQMDFQDGRLWILAIEERQAERTSATPGWEDGDVEEVGRLWRLQEGRLKPELHAPDSLPGTLNAFLLQDDLLWLAGDGVSVWDLKNRRLRSFGPAEGLTMKNVESLAAAGERIFAAGGSFEISSLDRGTSRWVPWERPKGELGHGTGGPYRMAGGERVLAYHAGGLFFLDLRDERWTTLKTGGDARCLVGDEDKIWIGAANGLRQYDSTTQTIRFWNSPPVIESALRVVHSYSAGHSTVQRKEVVYVDGLIRSQLRKIKQDHWRVRKTKWTQYQDLDVLVFNARIPGGVTAFAKDGKYLWMGAYRHGRSWLLLLHKPTESIVGGLRMDVRDDISSLAVSDKHVWAGTSYGDNALLRISKDAFLAVARTDWKPMGISPSDKQQLLSGMSRRDRVLYAFYSGNDEHVIDLVGTVDSGKASLEELFLLGWSCDPLGADRRIESAAWFETICRRYPDTPWSGAAREFAARNEALYARFDMNRDGRLDAAEKQSMLRDDEALGFPKPWEFRESDLLEMFKACDLNGDQRLDLAESAALYNRIPMYFDIGGSIALLSVRFKADANRNSHLEAEEFKEVIEEVRRLTTLRRKERP